jgi:hypothetical protein
MPGQSFGGLSASGVDDSAGVAGSNGIVWLEGGAPGLRTPEGDVLVLVTDAGLPPPPDNELGEAIILF